MARPGTNIGARIAKLKSAQERAKKFRRNERLASRPMSELLGVSWPILREWCNDIPELETSGAVVRGGNGIEWGFDPRRTIAVLLKAMGKRLDGQARKSREITKAIGVTLSSEDEAPSLSETKSLVDLTMTVTAAKEKQGGYTPAADVKDFIVGYNQAVVDGILGVRTKVDPSGALSPAMRKAVDDELRALAVKINGIAAKFIEGRLGAGL